MLQFDSHKTTRPFDTAVRFAPAIVWAGAIAWESGSPSGMLASTPLGGVGPFVLREFALHAFEFSFLALLLLPAVLPLVPTQSGNLAMRVAKAGLIVLAIAGSLALLNEIQQAFVPGRSSHLADVLADLVGVMAGLLIFSWAVLLSTPHQASQSR
ncbi:MAG: VanZ family protein [Chloroflexi bacterium]|nr:VanZ family protein [Chloroflexota bacterium]